MKIVIYQCFTKLSAYENQTISNLVQLTFFSKDKDPGVRAGHFMYQHTSGGSCTLSFTHAGSVRYFHHFALRKEAL